MIKSKEDYKYYLETDRIALRRPKRRGVRGFIKEKLISPDYIWDFQKILRKVEYLNNREKRGLFRQIQYFGALRRFKHLSTLLGYAIPVNCFGPGLFIVHRVGPIVIHPEVKIGANCRIHCGVVIGIIPGRHKAPHLGDNIFIGPGVKVFGDIEIADNISIGANAVVNKSFTESNITIAGVPARKVSSKYSLEDLKPVTEIKKDQNLLI
jgi:serine O-acetyltransferase